MMSYNSVSRLLTVVALFSLSLGLITLICYIAGWGNISEKIYYRATIEDTRLSTFVQCANDSYKAYNLDSLLQKTAEQGMNNTEQLFKKYDSIRVYKLYKAGKYREFVEAYNDAYLTNRQDSYDYIVSVETELANRKYILFSNIILWVFFFFLRRSIIAKNSAITGTKLNDKEQRKAPPNAVAINAFTMAASMWCIASFISFTQASYTDVHFSAILNPIISSLNSMFLLIALSDFDYFKTAITKIFRTVNNYFWFCVIFPVLLVGIELIVHGFFGISAFYIDYILTIITIGALLMAIIVTFFRRDSLYYSIMATLILLAQIIYQSSNTFFSEPHNYTNWFHFNQLHIYAHIGLVFILLILAFSYYFNKVEDSEEWAQKSRRMIAHSAINDLKIINWKIEEDESLTVEDLKRNANIKIEAMINSYYLLFTSSGVKGIVEPELFFRKLLTNLLEKQGYHQSETYVEVPDLHIETSLPLLQDYGFILVEMLVNAIKYSPQEEDSFKIEVSTSPTTLTMRVENTIDDSGESIPSLEYGMRIVQDLVSDKKGDIHRSQQGNRYAVQVVVPINRFRG